MLQRVWEFPPEESEVYAFVLLVKYAWLAGYL